MISLLIGVERVRLERNQHALVSIMKKGETLIM